MTPDKIISFVIEYFSDYSVTFIKTLRRPTLLIRPLWKESSNYFKESGGDFILAPRLFGFSAISIVLGLIIQNNIPNHLASDNYLQVIVTVIIFWIIFSSLVYFFLFPQKLKGNFAESLSLILQIVSVQYVIANVVALIWGVLYQSLLMLGMSTNRISWFGILGENPFYIYFFAQFIFLVIYIPYALASAYRFTRFGIIRILIGTIFLTFCWSFFSYSFFDTTSSPETGNGGISFLPTPTPQPGIVLTTAPVPTPTWQPGIALTVTAIPTPTPGIDCTELLKQSWHLEGTGPQEAYEHETDADALIGKLTIRITYDLHGLDALPGDASAIIFDQPSGGEWHYISLSNFGLNGLDGLQTVEIPISAFSGLDLNQPVGTLHTRFWHDSNYAVDILSIEACD